MTPLPDLLQSLLRLPLPVLGLVMALCLLVFPWAIRRRSPAVPWFKPVRPGTVYLFRSLQDPCLYKVGYTGRTAPIRQKELEAKLGSRLTLVATIHMPHAWTVEQHCHRALRARGWAMPWHPALGKEWYRIPNGRSLKVALRIMDATSRRAERVARLKRSWRAGAGRSVKIHL